MYPALAVIVLALAGFSVLASRSSRSTSDQLKGFVYVGAGALVVLAVVVTLVGILADRCARAEGLAIFGLFTYAIYLGIAMLITQLSRHR